MPPAHRRTLVNVLTATERRLFPLVVLLYSPYTRSISVLCTPTAPQLLRVPDEPPAQPHILRLRPSPLRGPHTPVR